MAKTKTVKEEDIEEEKTEEMIHVEREAKRYNVMRMKESQKRELESLKENVKLKKGKDIKKGKEIKKEK